MAGLDRIGSMPDCDRGAIRAHVHGQYRPLDTGGSDEQGVLVQRAQKAGAGVGGIVEPQPFHRQQKTAVGVAGEQGLGSDTPSVGGYRSRIGAIGLSDQKQASTDPQCESETSAE
jgi:hypothetical protein